MEDGREDCLFYLFVNVVLFLEELTYLCVIFGSEALVLEVINEVYGGEGGWHFIKQILGDFGMIGIFFVPLYFSDGNLKFPDEGGRSDFHDFKVVYFG